MLVQKIFHIHRSVSETRRGLGRISAYWHELSGVTQALMTADGIAHFEFKSLSGHRVSTDLVEVLSDNPDQVLFRSVGGNIELAGMVEFFPVRDNVTEVCLTLDYQLMSPLHRVMDRVTSGISRFLNCQLMRIQMHFDGVGAGANLENCETASLLSPQLIAQVAD